MDKDEMKNRISLALKDPILQQGFEIICKENAELNKKLNKIERKCKFNFVDLLHDVENESKQEEQLTKAKELLTRFIRKGNGAVAPSWEELITEAEQFLEETK